MNSRVIKIISLSLVFVLLGSVTTPFMSITEAAEIDRETAYKGLLLTGIVVLTIKWLTSDSQVATTRNTTGNYSQDKVYWLAKAVNAEARGEPYLGQVAVAAVILNRVASSQFPNTIYSVIYQQGQFSSVKDGQINLNPSASAYRAAKEALNGRDPSFGALYFYNPKTSSLEGLKWLRTREVTTKIGNHVFAK
ncbi:cell wall hydrolyses involved in spore germination [Halobacteroides halobius DSM 5150]|uniref:Cell wall hydrolyses involved in spore germination n=1 Tax=Halobacteroides halobius (strain ATCC 35273 / DSM 5150 / MD-1) TaxID=748449 RepID=L0KA19_HALHC|nr:cell wall hydrolase [Halobacteroides halobius]AGB40948.1 cell wall hydrolyses involved in spore germination [Halobacteroides halobius DSM 5150]